MSGRMGQLNSGGGGRENGGWASPSKPVAARAGAMPVPPADLGSMLEENQDGDGEGEQTESVEFAEADLHSVPFPQKARDCEMRVSSVLHHLVAVSTELQLGAVFTSHQSLQMGRLPKNLLKPASVQPKISLLKCWEVVLVPTWCFGHGSASVLKTTLAFDICQMLCQ